MTEPAVQGPTVQGPAGQQVDVQRVDARWADAQGIAVPASGTPRPRVRDGAAPGLAVPESAWVSAHTYYQDDLDPLVVGAVAPLVEELAARGLADEFFFLRYWDGGLHLRLRVLPLDPARRPEVEAVVGDRLAAYVSSHPSAQRMSDEEYARSAPVLAGQEGVASYARRLRPLNTVDFVAYRREHHRYGDGAAVRAVERHFCESSRIALRALAADVPHGRRVSAAGGMILLTWFLGCPDPRRLARWVAGRPAPGEDGDRGRDGCAGTSGGSARQRLAAADGRPPDPAVALARQMRVLAARSGEVAAGGTLVDWARSAGALRDALTAEVDGGRFAPAARAPGFPGRIATSDPAGGVPTVLDICAHLVCNRIGLSVVEERVLRGVCAAAVGVLAGEGS